ncbi:MAG: PAS domain-containing protein [Desulfamplus sp.]|nr:PAS domain-containing protein [Desulfamplus sp.]
MIYIDLILNLSLLVSLSIVSGFIENHCKISKISPNVALTLQGVLFGSAAVLGMMRPLILGPGLIFDGRSVMVSLCTLFFGPLSGVVASTITAAYRLLLGGVGTITGLSVITSSFIIGAIARFYLKPEKKPPSVRNLYILGFVVHLSMVAIVFLTLLSKGTGASVAMKIGPPVMLLYPLATILAGKILSDLLESRRQMCELQNTKGLLTSLLHSMYDIVFFKDINGVYLGCNKAFAEHLGLSIEEIIGKTDYDLFTKEDADFFRSNDKKMLKIMKPLHNEDWISYPDGRRRMIDTLKTPYLDSKGSLIGIIGVSRDITGYKKMSDIQEFLAQTISTTSNISVVNVVNNDDKRAIYPDNVVASSNAMPIQSFFETLAIYLAKTLEMDFVCIDRLEGDGLNATTLAVWSYGKFEDNITYALKDTPCGEVVGKTVCCFPANVAQFFPKDQVLQELNAESYVGVTLFSHTGKPIGLIAVIGSKPLHDRDIAESILKMVAVRASGELERLDTEAALLESERQLFQAQKLESIGRLAGGVAHDLNNMLSVIIGNAEMAIDELKPHQPAFNELQEIRKAAERSANLTRQLLAFARKQLITPKVLDLNAAIEDMLKMLTRIIGEDIELKWQPKDNLWQIKIDPSQIDQILANLCVNSRDAISDVGKITIETGMKTFDKDYCDQNPEFFVGDYVMLVVSDNGCGIDKGILSSIFEPFFTTKEIGKGTGLGLAMVYGIVKQNKGFINVYSELNQGTTFKIYFPRYIDESTPLIKENINNVAESCNETILIVEDEVAILHLSKMILQKLGYQVIAASTPKEAIRLAQEYSNGQLAQEQSSNVQFTKNNFDIAIDSSSNQTLQNNHCKIDLLITDVVMPDMNGRELARNIILIYPDIKVLFMSGYTADVIAHHGVLDSGVNFIQKPFSKQDLLEKVRKALVPFEILKH